jgi:DnaJ-class molecular chaperone
MESHEGRNTVMCEQCQGRGWNWKAVYPPITFASLDGVVKPQDIQQVREHCLGCKGKGFL